MNYKNQLKSVLHICVLLFFSPIALGAATTFQSATSKGTGGTGRAAIDPIDVISLNPAGLPHLLGRHFSVSTHYKVLSLGISDNTKESIIPGGIAYVRKNIEESPDTISQDFRVSLGEFWKDRWAVGLSVHYSDTKILDKIYNQVNGDVGVTYTPHADLGLSLVATDLAPVSEDIPEIYRNEAKIALGSYLIYKNFFRIRADMISNIVRKSNKLTYALGAESYIESWLVFRAGGARDELNEETWGTLGLGFLGPRFYINYAWEKTVARAEIVEDRNLHSIDLGIPF